MTTQAQQQIGSTPDLDASLLAVLGQGERPPRPSAVSAALTFGWRGLLNIKHVPEQLFDVTLTPILFTLMFTFIWGGAIEGSTSEYLQYILPGILVVTDPCCSRWARPGCCAPPRCRPKLLAGCAGRGRDG